MAELTDEQLDLLTQRIAPAIRNTQLQMELIDHCCCSVEELMTDGLGFEDALSRALEDLEPEGIHRIEIAVQQVLKPQTLQTMKATLFFSGFVAAFCIMLGMLFKIMHWPGADNLLFTGDLSLIVSMIMLIASTLYSSGAVTRTSFSRSIIGAGGGLLLGIGSCFKIMHWPGANIQILLGMILLTFVFLPLFFWQLYQREMKTA